MVPFEGNSVANLDGQSATHRIEPYALVDGKFTAAGGLGAVYRSPFGIPRSIMHGIRSTLVLLSGCAALLGSGCDSHVQLGAFSATVPNILWSATFETGDLTEWQRDGDGNVFAENAAAAPSVTADQVHNGRYAGKSTMGPTTEPTGIASSNYFYRNHPSPTEAYYGAWFYIPSTVTIRTWLSLMHFRGSTTCDVMNPVAFWDLNVWPVRDGSLPPGTLPVGSLTTHFFNYTTMVNADPLVYQAVPTDKWVHFEILLHKSAETTGRMTVWQDDVMIIDLPNVMTSYNDWVQWDAGGASNDIAPASASIYMDDATISLERLGDQAIPDERPQP